MLFVTLFAVIATVAARLIRHVALADLPHVQDEITYLLQGKTLASGRLSSPVLLPRAAFNEWFVDDRWSRFGIFPPGWPAVLALGLRLKLENWVNPLLHGFTVFQVATIAKRVSGRVAGLVAAAFFAFSPQALVLASSLMSHALVGACAVTVLAASTSLLLSKPRPMEWLSAGAGLGLMSATRPLCMVVVSIGFAAAIITNVVRRRELPLGGLLTAAAPIALGTILLLLYNRSLTGSIDIFPQNLYFNEHLPPGDTGFFHYYRGCNNLGFGRGCDLSIEDGRHTLENAFSNVGDNWQAWFLLAGGGPLFAFACAYGWWRGGQRLATTFLLALVAVNVLAYMLYWHPGTCYGARFYHSTLSALLLLSAIGVAALPSRRLLIGVIAAWFAWNGFALRRAEKELANSYWSVDDRFAKLAQGWSNGEALVMVAFGPKNALVPRLGWTATIPEGQSWMLSMRAQAALALNDPELKNRVIFAKFHPGLVDDLRRIYPTRRLYLYIDNQDKVDDTLRAWDDYVPTVEHDLTYPPDNFEGFRPSEERPKVHARTDSD